MSRGSSGSCKAETYVDTELREEERESGEEDSRTCLASAVHLDGSQQIVQPPVHIMAVIESDICLE